MTDRTPSLFALLADAPEVSKEISPGDTMAGRGLARYMRGGATALRSIRLALLAAGRDMPRRILDLPCGHGRVARYLCRAFPEAELVACDIDRAGVDYCSEHFGARPVYSTESPVDLRLPGRFDLIWSGSLLTHLPLGRWKEWFDLWEEVVEPDGLLVFSVCGRLVQHLMRGGKTYGLDSGALAPLLECVDREGFAYADYPGQEGYGVSLTSAHWIVRELMRRGAWKLLSYSEAALNTHQDVVVCQRVRFSQVQQGSAP